MKRHRSDSTAVTGLSEATAERLRLGFDIWIALANAIAANEEVQRKFRNVVVSRLARIEATVGSIHAFQLASQKWVPAFEKKVKKDAKASEEFIAQGGLKHGLKMMRYIYGRDEEPATRRDRRRKWSDWEI